MQCYAELLPPSGVTHALSIPFLSATETNLVVAKTSLLQIFSFINDSDESDPRDTEEKASRFERSYETKLLLLAEYDLPGTVTDISRVEILNSKSGGEAILLAFRDAKLSLIEWDPDRCGISTISIHYYEREDLTRSPWIPDLSSCASHLTVDPSSRCAILNFGLRNLAILPFHRPGDDLVMDDYDSHFDGDSHEMGDSADSMKQDEKKESLNFQTPYASSFVLPLTALDPSLCHPISFSFLYEYREPTFGILYSQVSTTLALLNERKDVVFYSVFTLDLEQRASTTLLSVARLPSDLFKIVALPPPVGGALLIGSNELVHIDQAGKTNAVGVNEFARQASTFSMADQSDLALRLEGCVVEQLGTENGELILVLSGGDMILVSFKLDGRSVSGLSVCLIPAHVGGNLMKAAASCSAALGGGRIFFGSEDTDSVLVGWSPSPSGIKRTRAHTLTNVDDIDLSDVSEDQDDDDNYEDDLYSGTSNVLSQDYHASNDSSTMCGNYNFRLHDTLPNIGPIRDITLGKSFGKSNSNLTSDLQLVSSYGSDKNGGLCILNREIDPFVINSLELDNAEAVWSVHVSETKVKASGIGGTSRKAEHYVIFSRSRSADKEESVVYTATDKNLQPFRAPEFNPNEDCTVDVGTLANGSRVVQVLKGEIRSYDASKF